MVICLTWASTSGLEGKSLQVFLGIKKLSILHVEYPGEIKNVTVISLVLDIQILIKFNNLIS